MQRPVDELDLQSLDPAGLAVFLDSHGDDVSHEAAFMAIAGLQGISTKAGPGGSAAGGAHR